MYTSECNEENHFFFSSRRQHTSSLCDWSSDVCSSDLVARRPYPGGMVTVLLAAARVAAGRLDMAVGRRANPDRGPGRGNGQPVDSPAFIRIDDRFSDRKSVV